MSAAISSFVLDDEHERATCPWGNVHGHSVADRHRREGDFRTFFAVSSHEVELSARP